MSEHYDRDAVAQLANNLEELDREIARLALLCRVDILEASVAERVLRKDASVCGTDNPVGFAKLHDLLMMHFLLWKKSADALGELQTSEVETYVINRLKKSFPSLAADWPRTTT